MKTVESYNEHFLGLRLSESLPKFLVYGNSGVAWAAIVGQDACYIGDECILQALYLSLQNDRHPRFAILLNAVGKRCSRVDALRQKERTSLAFEDFISDFLSRFILPKNGMLIKRFLTLHGQKFKWRSPGAFETICRCLVLLLISQFDGNPDMKRLLTDFVGQPSMLTGMAYANAYLDTYSLFHDSSRREFIRNGWREAIEEGLKETYRSGGKKLWIVITKMFRGQFPKDYPPSEAVLKAALSNFKSKKEVEERWRVMNVVPFQRTLMTKLDGAVGDVLPSVLTRIVFEYANTGCTWIDIPETRQ